MSPGFRFRYPVAGLLGVVLFSPALPVRMRAQAPAPISFSAGAWRVTLGGYVKLDVIHDFDAIASTDEFNPRNIAVDGRGGTDTRVFGRESRLSLGFAGPAEGRELKLQFEGDFFGAGNSFRLRHAYGQYGVLLAGQTWATFMDESNIPSTIDYETPLAAPFARQGLVRVSPQLSKSTELAFAVEESDPEIDLPSGVTGAIQKTLPDLVARLRVSGQWGHLQLSGFLGRTRFAPDSAGASSVTIGGVLASLRLLPFGQDAAYLEAAYGPGLGRYRGAPSAGFNAAGELKTIAVAGLTAGYEHHWSSRWFSNVVISPAWVTSKLGDPATTNDQFLYAAANLCYWFLPQRAWTGLEYLYGRRELRNGVHGSANRIQFAVRFDILGQ